jgi:cyclophilin family peptidyl-prolyl cis-trans isomerase/HEAT repeat protein
MTVEEEAKVLRLEDRREIDRALMREWSAHPNALHRARIALALGRIGPHVFDDANANGARDENETMAGLDLLVALAGDPVPQVRETAVFALGEIGDPSALPSLFAAARNNESPDVAAEAAEAIAKMAAPANLAEFNLLTQPSSAAAIRARATRYLFRWNSDEASARAAQLLDDETAAIRKEAAYALSRRAWAPAREKLELLLTDDDALVRAYAAQALGRIADAASQPVLIRSLGDIHPWVRTNAARSLASILDKTPAAARTTPAQALTAVLNLVEDPDPGARVTAIETLGYYAGNAAARQKLDALVESGSRVQREIAAGVLTRHLGASDRKLVERLIATDDPWTLVRIAENSQRAGANGAAYRAAIAKSQHAMARVAAISAIPESDREAERAIILAGIEDKDPVVRSAAIEAYAALPGIVPGERFLALRELASNAGSDALNDARVAAVTAVGTLDVDGRDEYFRGLLGDRDPVIRRIAAEALQQKLELPRPQYAPLAVVRPMNEYEEIVRWSRERHSATIRTARGDIELVLLSHDAPMTAWNFAELARKGYFDNTSFMRVVPNFVIQGGDPRNDMSGGPGYSIRDEINLQKYTRGALGMALSGPDTGGSQFFITHSPQPHLDGGYTIFGRVVDGMGSVVDQMERGDRVNTIIIDRVQHENPDIASIQQTPLPTEIGAIALDRLMTSVPDYATNRKTYAPSRDTIQLLSTLVQPGDRMEIFMGTWCDDSQREVPRMLKILDELESSYGVKIPYSLVAVNRGKNQPAELIGDRKIELVATFIYYRDGREMGRIVEFPEGLIEDHLLRIVSGQP